MKLDLKRFRYTKDTTIGKLYIDGEYFCYTLEDTVRGWGIKVREHTAIPVTSDNPYKIKITFSGKFKRDMPVIYTEKNGYELIRNGISFKGIRFHGGNDHLDGWGCPLIGYKFDGNDKIWRSAESTLTEKIRESETVVLYIKNELA